jgi:hypothetical protein
MGIMDETLRKQGIKADAITIDCIAVNKKIVLVVHDSKPDAVDIALGNKDGVIESSSSHRCADINEHFLLTLMKITFYNEYKSLYKRT